MQPGKTYDRSAEDVGNSVLLEHVNLRVPDQRPATLFYVTGLGYTREPYLMSGLENMWVNVGRNQFHLGPHGDPQVLRGAVGLVMPGREALLKRLAAVKERLAGTRFSFAEQADHVEATCPWGNRFRVYEPDAKRFGRVLLGIPYVEFDVPIGSSDGIVRFYRQSLGVRAETAAEVRGAYAKVQIGFHQFLYFRETDRPQPGYDGHHIQIYLNNFSGPHAWLLARNLISEESSQHQYRFTDIVDPDDGKVLFVVEHEVRSMSHPLYARPLVNRNPRQSNRDYAPDWDAGHWGMPHDD